ncbi:helix-turn-helix domain-containing protein [Streptacidiphilus sp. EB103A]|uniref:helix-turn-helix domain-containing protein n=1 Tax=Streptacidiphilus sp. EB103A TaxID=3156275 RepID=UPI0035180851
MIAPKRASQVPPYTLHPDVRRRRGAALLEFAFLAENLPQPGADPTGFNRAIARLVRICLPGTDPDRTTLDGIVALLSITGLKESADQSHEDTDEIFGGDLGTDFRFYEVPDQALGVYAGSPPDQSAGQRRQFARIVLRLVKGCDAEAPVKAATDLLTWAVQLPIVPRELFLRRERAGRTRAQVAAAVGGVSVNTVASWESGTAIPGPRDWKALSAAYGFSAEEFTRLLDRTGPPERRGAPRSHGTPASTVAATDVWKAPADDCGTEGVQVRRATTDAARLRAHPVWHDETTRPGAGNGMWFLDLGEGLDDPGADLLSRRTRSGPTRTPGDLGGTLGPVTLPALMHRGDWPAILGEMCNAITRFASPVMASQLNGQDADRDELGAVVAMGLNLSTAYCHANRLHRGTPTHQRHTAAVDAAVADALTKVLMTTFHSTL